jgi:NTE family protein
MKVKDFSLVLGGGVARGFIHIGVWKYLQEHNLIPSEVVGSSAGAIIGAGISLGMSWQELQEIGIQFNKRKIKILDPHIGSGLIGGKKIRSFFHECFGDVTFQELSIPLKVTAVDVEEETLRIFQE